jgi:hypothetical protein
MKEREKKGGSARPIIAGIGLVILLASLYVASIGPAAWLWKRDYISESAFETVYYPVVSTGRRYAWAGKSLMRYIRFWVPKD